MKKLVYILMIYVISYSHCFALTQSQKDTILSLHNSIRAQFKIPSLVWDTKIEKQAQDWANILAKKNTFAHSTSVSRK